MGSSCLVASCLIVPNLLLQLALMFTRFPGTLLDYNSRQQLLVEQIPYALFILEKSEGRKNVFLTEHTLLFVRRGQKIIHFADNMLTVDKNQLVFLKRGLYTMSEYIPDGETFEVLLLFIPDAFLQQFVLSQGMAAHPAAAPAHVLIPSTTLLESFAAQYVTYFGHRAPTLHYILALKIQELFLLLLASGAAAQLRVFLPALAHGAPLDLDLIVRQHVFEPVTIPELARLAGRSLASFRRDFESRYQMPPHRWISAQRLQQARLLVRTTPKSIAVIADECGYESVSHFIRRYKKEFGQTPASSRSQKATN